MATNVVEEDVEYESDPEEAKRSLTMRRRERASDDEADATDNNKREEDEDDTRVLSDDSDGEGGIAEYDDEEEEEELIEEEEVEEDVGVVEEGRGSASGGAEVVVKETDGDDVRHSLEDSAEVVDSEEKKENEPFAVPTAGAFYMHDDRFRDNAGGRNRRIHGGGRLWESKDERKWGHDKFEEISLHERRYQEGRRSSKGSYRGHAKSRGTDRGGYVQGNRKGYDSNSGTQRYNSNSRSGRYNSSSSNQSQVPRGVVRGRGPQRYESTNKSNGPAPQVQNIQSGKPHEKTPNGNLEKTSLPTSNAESERVPAKKQVFASNLNIASPPFYPSGSSNKDVNLNQKRDVQSDSTRRNESFPVQQNNALLRQKNAADLTTSMEKLYIDESVVKPLNLNNVHMTPPINASQSSHHRAAGRGMAFPAQMNYQLVPSYNQVNKDPPTHPQGSQRSSAPGHTSTHVQSYVPKLGHRPGSGSQSSSPPKASSSNNSFDSGVINAASESGKSKVELVAKGVGVSQGGGRAPFIGESQVTGAGSVGVSHGDQNFPTFLPVMQFGGQHPSGIGVPAVGMAFPGYVGQPQQGRGGSEMTWLPVLTGAAGALGAAYCSPYLAFDGAYGRQSGQTSAMGTSSKENNAKKANNELKPSLQSEVSSEEFGQRQNKPRRYSEMNFGQ